MKKHKKIIFLFAIIVILLCIGLGLLVMKQKSSENAIMENQEDYNNMINNSTMYDSKASLEELKKEYAISGTDDLYQVETEYDGRKVVVVKPNINLEVAFAGMIQNAKPIFNEVDKICAENYPTKNGIWINEKSRDKVITYLNNCSKLSAEYYIDSEGYLKVSNVHTDYDRKIKKLIEGKKQFIIDISSTFYMVDVVTGEIVENNYNDFDEYQTYDYVSDDNKMIIFLSENSDNKLQEDEIFESIILLTD